MMQMGLFLLLIDDMHWIVVFFWGKIYLRKFEKNNVMAKSIVEYIET